MKMRRGSLCLLLFQAVVVAAVGSLSSEMEASPRVRSRLPSLKRRSLSNIRDQICPIDRHYPPMKYGIQPYPDDNPHDHVEDDLAEISSLGFASHTDHYGRKYAYVISDKEQISLKVIQFNDNTGMNNGPWTGNASVAAVYTLNVDYSNDDIEDLSLGPCSDDVDSDTCIYLGNFGNNPRGSYVPREQAEIFKFPEPAFSGPDGTPVSQIVEVSTLQFSYDTRFDSATLDAEALFVDWTGVNGQGKGDIYIVLKGRCGKGVQRLPVSSHKHSMPGHVLNLGNAERVTEDPPRQQFYDCGDDQFDAWQGADMNRDGTLIAMITQGYPPRVYFFARESHMSVADALSRPSCDYVSPVSSGLLNEKKYEAVAFVNAEGTTIAETTECKGGRDCTVPIYFHELVLTDSEPKSTHDSVVLDDDWKELTVDTFADGTFGNYRTTQGGLLNVFPTLRFSCDGGYSIHIGSGNGLSSSILHASDYDCSPYSILKVSFEYAFSETVSHLSTLFLELSLNGGRGYFIVHSIAQDVQVQDRDTCHKAEIVLYAEDFGLDRNHFTDKVRLRFRSNAPSDNDIIYIDAVRLEGHTGM